MDGVYLLTTGRRGNIWLSPKGSMMFSTVLTVQPWSRLFKKMSLLQHIVALSMVSAVQTIPVYEVVVKHCVCSLVFATSA